LFTGTREQRGAGFTLATINHLPPLQLYCLRVNPYRCRSCRRWPRVNLSPLGIEARATPSRVNQRMKGWLIRAQTTRSKEYLVKAKCLSVGAGHESICLPSVSKRAPPLTGLNPGVNHPFIAPPHSHLQSLPYCNTIAIVHPFRNIRPRTDPPFVCHTPYNIGDGIIV